MYPPNSHIKDYSENDFSGSDRYTHNSHVKECLSESDLIVNNRLPHSPPTPEPLIEMPEDEHGRLITRLPPLLQEAERYVPYFLSCRKMLGMQAIIRILKNNNNMSRL